MMSKTGVLSIFLTTIFICLVFPVTVLGYEQIKNFDSVITLHKDGSFDVEEVIQYDFDVFNKHGIFRIIPLKHPQDASVWYKDRKIEVTVNNVQVDRASVPFNLNESNNELEIKIGDPLSTISGIHEYRIYYRVEGGLSYYGNNNPELYWNATGNDWEVPILNAKVTVNDPDSIAAGERACYRGSDGGSLSCDLQ